LTEAEIYEFDINGYIIYRDMIPSEAVHRMNEIIDATDAGREMRHTFGFLGMDPCFMELMAHPRLLNIMRVMIGDWLRLDHAYGIQMTRETDPHENLHGGPRTDNGEHQYQWVQGKMYNGLIVVMHALEDVNPADGGLICVPGSHKANVAHKPPLDSHLVVNPSFLAGDTLIFTEALIHGTRRWRGEGRRRSVLYKYSPGHSTWGDPENLKPYREMAATDLQRDLLRGPSVGRRTRLAFPAG
jgi:hypothetical protein